MSSGKDSMAIARSILEMSGEKIKPRPKEALPMPGKPRIITDGIDTLERLGFNPMEVGVDLFRRNEANGNLKECRLVWEKIMDYSYPRRKSVEQRHSFDAIEFLYADDLKDGQTIETVDGTLVEIEHDDDQ